MTTQTCYCRQNSHVMGSVEKCYGAVSWTVLKARSDALLEAAKAAVEHHEWRTKIQGGEDTWGKGKRAVMPQIRAAIEQAEGRAS